MTTPSTTPYELGDVVLVEMEYTDRSSTKKRPVVVISNSTYHQGCADTVIVPLTSNTAAQLRPGDYPIADWWGAGLRKASIAKGKPTTIARSTIERKLGSVNSADLQGVLANVKTILG